MPYDPSTGMVFDDPRSGDPPEERGTIVTFELKPKLMKAASDQQGRPVYENREYIKIVQPANRNTEVFREATDDDKRKWHVRYRQFKEDQEQIGDGVPLDQWPAIDPATLMNLRGVGLRTVQDLAGVSDVSLKNIGMGAAALRTKAQAFLDEKVNGAELSRALAENATLKDQMAVMNRTMEAMQAQIAKLAEAKDA